MAPVSSVVNPAALEAAHGGQGLCHTQNEGLSRMRGMVKPGHRHASTGRVVWVNSVGQLMVLIYHVVAMAIGGTGEGGGKGVYRCN
jgi:hypothetical protein